MVGFAGNLATGNFLWKGELAYKFNRAFQGNDQDGRLAAVERDTLDMAPGLEYSANGDYTVSLETSFQYIRDWDDAIQGIRENEGSVAFGWNKNFLHETLDLQYLVSYRFQDNMSIHQVRSRYDFTDQLSGRLEAMYLDISDRNNIFRNKSRMTLKLEYQF